MKNNSSSSKITTEKQKELDSLLIKAAENPSGEVQDTNGLTQTVDGLLAQGANVNAATTGGHTALMIAAYNGNTKVVSALLSRDNVDWQAKKDKLESLDLKSLIKESDDLLDTSRTGINAVGNYGYTALMLAAQDGHTKVASALLACDRTEVNEVNNDGYTALMLAAQDGHTKVASALLACDRTEVNEVNNDGYTALMIAAYNGNTKVVSAFLDCKRTKVNVARPDGSTASIFAIQNGHTEVASILLSRDDFDWQVVKDKSNYPTLQNLQKEVAFLLAVVTPEEELRNSIITDFNQRNPRDQIQQKDNSILGAGFEKYNNLKDFKSWYAEYLTDSGVEKNEAKKLANQKFFDLVNNPKSPQETSEKDQLITHLTSKLETLDALIIITRIAQGIEFKDQATPEDQEEDKKELEVRRALDAAMELSPEDFYELTTKIIDNSKVDQETKVEEVKVDQETEVEVKSAVPTLLALSLVAVLRKARIDQASPAPATTTNHNSVEQIATPQQNLGGLRS